MMFCVWALIIELIMILMLQSLQSLCRLISAILRLYWEIWSDCHSNFPINAICLELDIASLFALRQVNLRARRIVIHCQNTDLLLITLSTASTHYCGRSQLDELHRPTSNVFSVIIKLRSLCGTIYGDLVYLIQ